ncbi:MAG: preprotein translocase subunit SecG [Nannocystaceae bacterium]
MFDILVTIVTIIFTIVSLIMVLVILLQAGKGGMGTALGGGASQSVFGGGGGADVLAKATQGMAATFMICSIFLAYASSHSESSRLKDKSEDLEEEAGLLDEDAPIDYEKLGNYLELPEGPIPDASAAPPPIEETSPEPPADEAPPEDGGEPIAAPSLDGVAELPAEDTGPPDTLVPGDAEEP